MSWLKWGGFGILVGFFLWALLFLADHIGGSTREVVFRGWALTGGPVGAAFDRIVVLVGNHLGVSYGYIPYYPSRHVEIFLRILAFLLPVLLCFLGGVIARVFFVTIRRLARPLTSE
jgi:hypothetical protein